MHRVESKSANAFVIQTSCVLALPSGSMEPTCGSWSAGSRKGQLKPNRKDKGHACSCLRHPLLPPPPSVPVGWGTPTRRHGTTKPKGTWAKPAFLGREGGHCDTTTHATKINVLRTLECPKVVRESNLSELSNRRRRCENKCRTCKTLIPNQQTRCRLLFPRVATPWSRDVSLQSTRCALC